MRIGEMAKKAGITVRTLQYYDQEALLSPSAESDGGFRLYTDKDMVRLIQILTLKQLGFPLSEIKKRLTKLDTPEDVMDMLKEQSGQVRNKIKHLTESLEAMEKLNEEIAQMETVNFKKYADILLNLQIKNERYWMIKHFDDDALEVLRNRIGSENTALMTDTLNHHYHKAAGLLANSVPPESEKAQDFTAKFMEVLMDLTGGDMSTVALLSELMDNASSYDEQWDKERQLVRAFMKEAMSIYIQTDRDFMQRIIDNMQKEQGD